MSAKVIIVVLGADGAYTPLIRAVRDTWGPMPPYKALYCYGRGGGRPDVSAGTATLIGDDLICGFPEGIKNIHFKTLASFQYLLQHEDFDYVFRCCAGSYINKAAMVRFLIDKPKSRFYCGVCGHKDGITYASGSGYFLSKDLVQTAVARRQEPWSFTQNDDIAMGFFMKKQGVSVSPGALRVDFGPSSKLDPVGMKIDWGIQYHYHFRHNIGLMKDIHCRLQSLRGGIV